MPVCSFCKASYEWPRGVSIVQKDGTVKYLCSKKCRRSVDMGRDSKKVKWARKNYQDAEAAKKKKE